MTKEDLLNLIERTFGTYSIKKVTKTDINKSAYVPNIGQKKIFESLGIDPLDRRQDIKIKELYSNRILTISYYATLRVGANRSPEPRMGLTDLISYLKVGDELLFTSDNESIFIYNITNHLNLDVSNNYIEEKIYSQIDIKKLKEKASNIEINVAPIEQKISVYPRNNLVKSYVKIRSNYTCEMPKCTYTGFVKINGEKYIEIHHVIPLSEDGEDSIKNTVALCPNCHRKIHYSDEKIELTKQLKNYLKKLK